jgi:hypothetical protein
MRLYFLICCLSYFGLSFSQEGNEMSSDTIISWNVRSNLSWSDFQGETNPFDLGMAMTSYEIKILPEIVTVDEEDRI